MSWLDGGFGDREPRQGWPGANAPRCRGARGPLGREARTDNSHFLGAWRLSS